jgi:hypothetical protein
MPESDHEKSVKRLHQFASLMGSSVRGEAHAAFDKYLDGIASNGFPPVQELAERYFSTVTAEEAEGLRDDLAKWSVAYQALEQENAYLKCKVAGQSAIIAIGRKAKVLLKIGFVAGILALGLRYSEAKAATPEAGLRKLLDRTRWQEGDTTPVVVNIGGMPIWVLFRGWVDTRSNVDSAAMPIPLHCLEIHSESAEHGEGSLYLTPHPYLLWGAMLRWSTNASVCRWPGQEHYE